MKLAKKLFALLLCLCLMIPLMSAAAASPKMVLTATAPDSGGFFTLTVAVIGATFDGFGIAIGYDKNVVTPASWTSGSAATDAADCIQKESTVKDLSVFGNILAGQLILLGYSESNPDFSVTAGAAGTTILSLRFKVIGQGLSGLCVTDNEANGLTQKYTALQTSFAVNLPAALNGGKATTAESETEMTKEERTKNTLILQLGNYAAVQNGALCHIYAGEKSVTPYTTTDTSGNSRTMVPLRFIGDRLGAATDWKGETQTAIITLNGTTIVMKVGSTSYTVDGVTKTMDTAPELKSTGDGTGSSRTMVPFRFVAEALGKDVCWDQTNSLVIITERDAPWQLDRDAEKALTSDALLLISPLLRDTIQ